MFDVFMWILIVLYFTAILGSMGFLVVTWARDMRRKRKPKLKLVKRSDED